MFENIRFAALPGSFMAVSILGFLITVVYRESLRTPWTFALCLFFLILFVASFLSLHYGPVPGKDIY